MQMHRALNMLVITGMLIACLSACSGPVLEMPVATSNPAMETSSAMQPSPAHESPEVLSGYADNDGVRIHYEVEGNGPALMMVNWWTGSIADWRMFGYVDGLKEDYTLILVDMRGHGQSDKPHETGAYAPEIVVSDIIAVLDELGIEKSHYFGHSLGGTLGWALALHAPERFHSLIISAEGPGSMVSKYAEVPREEGADAWARGFEEVARAHGVWTPEIYDAYASIDVDAVALASKELNQTDASPILESIQTPALLIAVPSDEDYATMREAADRMPNATLYVSGKDHGGTGVRSDLLIPQISNFLATIEIDAPISSSTAMSPTATLSTSVEPMLTTVTITSTILISEPVAMELVFIPAGKFLMGSDPTVDQFASRHDQPQHEVELSGFYISKYEVTNQQYEVFTKATGHQSPRHWIDDAVPPGIENHPVVWVSWDDAVLFAKWFSDQTGQNFRLPSEAEWEKACRGPDGALYPWGNSQPDGEKTNYDSDVGATTRVGSYSPKGDSPYGVADMAGNVWEWTGSLFADLPYRADGREDLEATGRRVMRGGAFYWGDEESVRCAERDSVWMVMPSFQDNDVGFRVVLQD